MHKSTRGPGGDYYELYTTNTIDDITGAKEKMSSQGRRWDGFYCIKEARHPRQPQDFSARIQPQTIVANARPPIEQESAAPVITPI